MRHKSPVQILFGSCSGSARLLFGLDSALAMVGILTDLVGINLDRVTVDSVAGIGSSLVLLLLLLCSLRDGLQGRNGDRL
jgi:hypothetical protein